MKQSVKKQKKIELENMNLYTIKFMAKWSATEKMVFD
jgi:hypothetical protein